MASPVSEAVAQPADQTNKITLVEFLETKPPSQRFLVSQGFVRRRESYPGAPEEWHLVLPEITLFCENEKCNGDRIFRSHQGFPLSKGVAFNNFFAYRCSNCAIQTRIYSVSLLPINNQTNDAECYKYGEHPAFSPKTPSKLLSLIGPDRDLFLKGRRCETQGLGIASFAYYRRVIENQKNRIFDEILRVSRVLNADTDLVKEIETAKTETQFSKGVDAIRASIPQVLLIDGHNPLSLLHTALSDGLHDRADDHCLALATSVRVVLGELSERLSHALKEEAELKSAVSKLLQVKAAKKQPEKAVPTDATLDDKKSAP